MHSNKIGPGPRSRFLVLTKTSAATGDENASYLTLTYSHTFSHASRQLHAFAFSFDCSLDCLNRLWLVQERLLCIHSVTTQNRKPFFIIVVSLTERCSVAPTKREGCGYPRISKRQCQIRGCCFDNSIYGTKWCFPPPGWSLSFLYEILVHHFHRYSSTHDTDQQLQLQFYLHNQKYIQCSKSYSPKWR